MKAIMISIKPKWCAKIMNGEKTIEFRTSKALANAIEKLIDENGYADIYVYCSKQSPWIFWDEAVAKINNGKGCIRGYKNLRNDNGKVLFKFRCYKVKEMTPFEEVESPLGMAYKLTKDKVLCCFKAHLHYDEYNRYLKGKNGYAIHIGDLEIFDRPLELNKFKRWCDDHFDYLKGKCLSCKAYRCDILADEYWCDESRKYLTKAPQNFCYVEVE